MGLDNLMKNPHNLREMAFRSWVPFVFLLGTVVVVWILPVAGPPAHFGSVKASSSYQGGEFPAANLHDYSTTESMAENNQWLLPDGTKGSVDFTLSYPTTVAELFVLNTRNRDYNDRQAIRLKATLFLDGERIWQEEFTVNPYPDWTRIPVTTSKLADRLILEVLDYEGLGGGLNEVRLRAANPAGPIGTFIGKTFFVLFWILPILVFLRALRGFPGWLKWLGMAGLALVLYTMFWQFMQRPSFPYGHEFATHKERVAVYLWHILRGDIFPLWSSSSVLGFGSPFPLFYHRSFYYVAAPAYLVIGSAKASALFATAVFSTISVSGILVLLRKSGTGGACALLLALCLPLLNYCYFNWTVRQAFSEYAAMCLVPWMFLWCKCVLQETTPKTLFIFGSVLFPILFFTHSLVFFLSAVPVLATLGVRLYNDSLNRRELIVNLSGIGCVFLALAGPLVLLQLQFVDNLNFKAVIAQYNPLEQFVPLRNYFFDPNRLEGKDFVNVQLNGPFVASAIGLFTYLMIRHGRRGWNCFSRYGGVFACVFLCWYLFLQTRLAGPVYEFIPGFAYVQFPWRSLTFITVLLVILNGSILQALDDAGGIDIPRSTIGGLVLFILTLSFTPFQRTITREWYDGHFYESVAPADIGSYAFNHKDYWPVITDVAVQDAYQYMAAVQPRALSRSWSGETYEVKRTDPHLFEDMLYEYTLKVHSRSIVSLPSCFSGFEMVEIREPGGKWAKLNAFRTAGDFRVQFECNPGEYELRLRLPTVLSLVGF